MDEPLVMVTDLLDTDAQSKQWQIYLTS